MAPELTLYVDAAGSCRWVMTAWVALCEKRLPFTERVLDLTRGEQRAAGYLARSLTGTVPALEHDGRLITESLAIAEYLAETFRYPDYPRLFAADLGERARLRQLMSWLRAAAPDAGELIRVAGLALAGGRATVCSEWSIADADLAFALAAARAGGATLPAALATFVEREHARESVQRWLARPRLSPG
jgi:glutathione S-transferase